MCCCAVLPESQQLVVPTSTSKQSWLVELSNKKHRMHTRKQRNNETKKRTPKKILTFIPHIATTKTVMIEMREMVVFYSSNSGYDVQHVIQCPFAWDSSKWLISWPTGLTHVCGVAFLCLHAKWPVSVDKLIMYLHSGTDSSVHFPNFIFIQSRSRTNYSTVVFYYSKTKGSYCWYPQKLGVLVSVITCRV